MRTLAELLQSLPPELYKDIYELTFQTATGEHRIDSNYKPSSLLQVSKETRDLYAKSYFGGESVFVMKVSDCRIIRKWFSSLSNEHVCMLHEVRVEHEPEEKKEVPIDRLSTATLITDFIPFADWAFRITGRGGGTGMNVFKLEVRHGTGDNVKTTWMSYGDISNAVEKGNPLNLRFPGPLEKVPERKFGAVRKRGCLEWIEIL